MRKDKGFASSVEFKTQLTLKAGASNQWHIVKTVTVEGETFVEVGKQVNWFCLVVCGRGRSGNPLKRTRTFEHMRKDIARQLCLAPAGCDAEDSDDPMASLGMEHAERLPRRRAAARKESKRQRQSKSDQTTASHLLTVRLPASAPAGAEQVALYVKDVPNTQAHSSKNAANASLWIHTRTCRRCWPLSVRSTLRTEFLTWMRQSRRQRAE